ncbi:MAG: lysophospholipase [Fuerstiella sp.]|nr:lysophospholipase [Fuerstiella sp.]
MTIPLYFGGLVCIVVLAELIFRQFAAKRIRHVFENVPPFGVVPAEFSPGARQLSFRSTDGLRLSGSLHSPVSGEPPRGLVIFCPELSGNHWMATHYCHSLLNNGFAVLSFDFRNQGQSDSQDGYVPIHWVTEYEMQDIAGALEFIETDEVLSTLPLAAFGVSRGGAAALAAACRYPRIRAVLADSAFGTMGMTQHYVKRFGRLIIPGWIFKILPDWHIEITLKQAMRYSETARNCRYVHLERETIHRDDTSVKLISGMRDSYVTPTVAGALADLFGGEQVLWMVERAKHNMARAVAKEEYDRCVAEHFEPLALNSSTESLSPVQHRTITTGS